MNMNQKHFFLLRFMPQPCSQTRFTTKFMITMNFKNASTCEDYYTLFMPRMNLSIYFIRCQYWMKDDMIRMIRKDKEGNERLNACLMWKPLIKVHKYDSFDSTTSRGGDVKRGQTGSAIGMLIHNHGFLL